MRKILLLILSTFFILVVRAQMHGTVKGIAFDTISKQPVSAATITVLEKKDSSLVSFTMTGADGQFILKGLANGDYRLLITHVNYHNSNTYFSVTDSRKNVELGNLVMNDKAKVLEEVVLTAEAPPVTMINDTIQYNAGSFKVQPNASVEQLLKKLPGVKVEKDGTIKAQGETVNRVLVDGKEFFGNDPKMATKNLPADAVDKVQVYDKQSDQAQLTGFEDGNYEKTINLKLKKDKKKGLFGKVNAGVGDKERFEGKFNLNSFKGARQFSAIGMGNNTNAEGFSFMDILNFTGELARMQRGGGGNININMSGEEAAAMGLNIGRNRGINTAYPKQESDIQRQYFLPDSSYFYKQRSLSARAVYTEPLWKRSLLEFSAGKSDTKNNAVKTTHDYNKSNGKYDRLNTTLSNDFENTYGYITAGIRMRTQKKKLVYSVGVNWQQAELEGKIIAGTKDSVISKTFSNILPTARFQYNFSRYKTFTLNYTTSTNQPSITQLQPVPDVSNPLNIRLGNPDLKQEFNHTIQSNLNLINPIKSKNLFVNMMARFTGNRISNYDSVNLATGTRTSQPVNVNGVYNLNSNISYSMPVRFLKGNVEISSGTGFNQNKQLINNQAGGRETNTIKTFTIGPEIRLDMNPTNKLNVGLGAAYNFNRTKYSLQSALNTNYLFQEYSASVDWEMPARFFFSTEFTYSINSQRAAGFNTKVPLWHASISKQVLKYNRGEIKLSARDLLNQNIGVYRNTNNNYTEDSRVLTLQRFFLLSFTYSLSKTGLNNTDGGGIRIVR